MVYLLDTNILSDVMRNPQGQAAQEYRRRSLDTNVRLATSIIVAAEMRYGVNKKGSAVLALRVDQMLASIEVLPLEPGADTRYGELRVDLERRGQPIGQNGMLLAAHALALDAVMVTDNVREFSRVTGLRVENWLRV
jgi:tRNA(fMet)-specific endonuclease VapC